MLKNLTYYLIKTLRANLIVSEHLQLRLRNQVKYDYSTLKIVFRLCNLKLQLSQKL